MNIPCDFCGNILKHKGGLVFSPPSYKHPTMVWKYHLCRGCYNVLMEPIFDAIRQRKEELEK